MYEITYLNLEKGQEDWESIVKKVLNKCFGEEGLLDSKLIITITFTTPEEIRKTFNIQNDFTPEEEQQIREENQWCMDNL